MPSSNPQGSNRWRCPPRVLWHRPPRPRPGRDRAPRIGLAVDLVRRFLPKGTDQRMCMVAAIWLIGQCSVFVRNREQLAAPPVGLALDESAVEQLAQLVSHWAAAALAQPS